MLIITAVMPVVGDDRTQPTVVKLERGNVREVAVEPTDRDAAGLPEPLTGERRGVALDVALADVCAGEVHRFTRVLQLIHKVFVHKYLL